MRRFEFVFEDDDVGCGSVIARARPRFGTLNLNADEFEFTRVMGMRHELALGEPVRQRRFVSARFFEKFDTKSPADWDGDGLSD